MRTTSLIANKTVDRQKRVIIKDGKGNSIVTDYFITENGEVIRNGKVLKLCKNRRYMQVTVSVSGDNYTRLIHRLVAEAFISNPENKPCVNHKNGNKHDNRVENLEFVTQKENIHHAIVSGLKVNAPGSSNGMSKLTEAQVKEIRKKGNNKYKGYQQDLAKEYKVNQPAISDILLRKKWKHI
ncbi:HNH endonuclease [Elizabethkingia meningoseptica]|uniref:HNH endonuclease n=1 Tax=Elizabethkingia TaxID=308865 RepID=UPI0023B0655E|nr:HNH endonuclease [Elizabethkingia meningoseptica]MDE5507724.1 HNH endonuclease [Elizabethkingia meningoseptica]MDV3768157.1 HNH endonuclease [Elizabethkingia anophelis]